MNSPSGKNYFSLHGLTLAVRADDAGIQAHFLSLFRYFGMQPLPAPGDGALLSLDLASCENLPQIPADAQKVAPHAALEVYRTPHAVWMHDARALFRIDPGAGQGRGWLHQPAWQNLEKLTQSHIDIIVYALLCMLQHHNVYALHGACVVQRDAACLIVGESGSGKSTLALGFLEQGWGYLSDDSVLLRPGKNGQVEALSLRKRLYVFPETARHVAGGTSPAEHGHFGNGGKQFLDTETLYAGQVRAQCVPNILIFPEIVDQAESELVPVPAKSRSYYDLLRHSALLGGDAPMARRHLAMLKMLVNQTRSYSLRAGRDLKYHPGKIVRLLTAVAENAITK